MKKDKNTESYAILCIKGKNNNFLQDKKALEEV